MKVPINYLPPECKHERQRIFAGVRILQKFAVAHVCTPEAGNLLGLSYKLYKLQKIENDLTD